MSNLDAAIARTLQLAIAYEQESDRAFARGAVLAGARLYRFAVQAVAAAERLAEVQALGRH